MKRLTEKHPAGYGLVETNDEYCDTYCSKQPVQTCRDCAIWKAIQKLGKYEDLQEQCIKETTLDLRMMLDKWHIFFNDLAEVVKYRELEKAGLLHIAPFKDGTTIYFIEEDWVFDGVERYITKTSYLHGVTEYEIGELNKDYWLTYEAAEKALRNKDKDEE